MTKREIINKIENYKKMITLAQIYKDEYIIELGGLKEYQNYIDEALDAIIRYNKELKK